MGLLSTVRGAIKIADNVTKDLQPQVTHKAWIGQDGEGAATYASAVKRDAIVEKSQRLIQTMNGMVYSKHKVTFIGPIANPSTAAGRTGPVDPRDVIILPDGTTGPILDAGRADIVDRVTGRPMMHEVWLG